MIFWAALLPAFLTFPIHPTLLTRPAQVQARLVSYLFYQCVNDDEWDTVSNNGPGWHYNLFPSINNDFYSECWNHLLDALYTARGAKNRPSTLSSRSWLCYCELQRVLSTGAGQFMVVSKRPHIKDRFSIIINDCSRRVFSGVSFTICYKCYICS
jgi:hypothetical protein